MSKRNSLVLLLSLAAGLLAFYFLGEKRIVKAPGIALPPSDSEIVKSPCRADFAKTAARYKKIHSSKKNKQFLKLMSAPIDWLFKDIHGQVIDLYCFRGKKAVVINFWATWCPPCIKELPSLSRLAENNKDEVFVAAISSEPAEIISDFLNHSFSDLSPYLKIAQAPAADRLKIFPEDTLPATYIFNKKGFLKIKALGPKDWSDKNVARQILNLP